VGIKPQTDLFLTTAKLVSWIITGHPFIDGNKRTGIECADIFLRKNGYYLEIGVENGVDFGLKVAKNMMDVQEIRRWLKENARKDK